MTRTRGPSTVRTSTCSNPDIASQDKGPGGPHERRDRGGRGGLPDDLGLVLAAALALEPEDRTQSAAELSRAPAAIRAHPRSGARSVRLESRYELIGLAGKGRRPTRTRRCIEHRAITPLWLANARRFVVSAVAVRLFQPTRLCTTGPTDDHVGLTSTASEASTKSSSRKPSARRLAGSSRRAKGMAPAARSRRAVSSA